MTTRTAPAPSPASIPAYGSALVCLPSPEQRDFAFLEAEIRLRHLQVGRLEAEIAPLIAALEKFEWEYKGRLGALQRELHELQGLIERLEHRTVRIHARLAADPSGVLGDLFTRDELNEIGEMFGIEIPASWVAPDEAAERQERERAWRFHQGTNRNDEAEEEILRQVRRGRARHVPQEERKEIRTLYRSLARLCHPDLAEDEADRERRQELMLQINDAWERQDLDDLRRIERDRGGVLGWRSLANWAERVIWARRECVRLDSQVIALTERLQALRSSDTFPLWFNPSLGNSVITQRATSLRIDIANAHFRVDEAKDAFKQALQYYAARVA
ncbi:MAG: hypothetical protein H0V37_10085 [Chloroflexia bacterium]|nr:hypothetical protein [Chloroflexia bacterium]